MVHYLLISWILNWMVFAASKRTIYRFTNINWFGQKPFKHSKKGYYSCAVIKQSMDDPEQNTIGHGKREIKLISK